MRGGGYTIISKIEIIISSALFGIVGSVFSHLQITSLGLPFGIEIAFLAMPFVAVGNLLKRSYQSYETWHKAALSVVLLLISLVLYRYNLPHSVTEGFNHVEMSIGSCGNLLLFYITALAGAFGIIFLASVITVIKSATCLQKLGKCTLACLGTHGFIISNLYVITNQIGIPFWVSSTVAFILVLLLTYPLQNLAEKYFPNLVGKN